MNNWFRRLCESSLLSLWPVPISPKDQTQKAAACLQRQTLVASEVPGERHLQRKSAKVKLDFQGSDFEMTYLLSAFKSIQNCCIVSLQLPFHKGNVLQWTQDIMSANRHSLEQHRTRALISALWVTERALWFCFSTKEAPFTQAAPWYSYNNLVIQSDNSQYFF